MIDDHVHPFPLDFVAFTPERISLDVSPDGSPRRRELACGRLDLELMQVKLAELLGVDGADVASARDATARADWTGWLRRLFTDAGITGMILDEAAGPAVPEPPGDLAEAAGLPIWHMARVDLVVDALLTEGADARAVLGAVEAYLDDAAAAGCVAYKTILAYRTGLAVAPDVDLDTAQRSLDADAGGPVRRRGKALRDLVLRTVLARAADLNRPVQIHTGFGDSELRLGDANPLLLEDLLRTPEGSAASVVLIHGSYPWHQAAAYLAATRPNVWVELSLSNLFAPVRTAQRLVEILELAPRGRVLLGSDGHGLPETHWFGCRVLAEAWQHVAGELRRAGARPAWVEDTRHAIFEGNARSLYALR